MDFIIDFYKNLDILNLIIFWGVIIVVILLLIFSIIIVNKNKKLQAIISNKKNENNENKEFEELPILKTDKSQIIEKNNENKKQDYQPLEKNIKEIKEETKFIAEEHVQENDKNTFLLPNIKKVNEIKEEKPNYQPEPIKLPTGPYQRNVLKEMSLNQTSPIGIIRKENQKEKEKNKAIELHETLNSEAEKEILNKEIVVDKIPTIKIEKEKHQDESTKQTKIYQEQNTKEIKPTVSQKKSYEVETYIEKVKPIIENNNQNVEKTANQIKKEKYLEEVSKKLNESIETDDIDRTENELKQEEEAIISYEELMKKRDSIKIIDEEEAIISIDELMKRNNNKEKLYNLTEEEENDKFINELKSFRSDL